MLKWKGMTQKKGRLRLSVEAWLLRPKALMRSSLEHWHQVTLVSAAATRLGQRILSHWQWVLRDSFSVWASVRVIVISVDGCNVRDL